MRLVIKTEQTKPAGIDPNEQMDYFLVTAFNYSATKKHSVLQLLVPIKLPVSPRKLNLLRSVFKNTYGDEIEKASDVVITSVSHLGQMSWNEVHAGNE